MSRSSRFAAHQRPERGELSPPSGLLTSKPSPASTPHSIGRSPKGTDLSVFTAQDLEIIAAKLNTRPTLDYRTPAHDINHLLQADQ